MDRSGNLRNVRTIDHVTVVNIFNLFSQEQLDMRLQQRQARETGICPVRRELYSQCFGKVLPNSTFLI